MTAFKSISFSDTGSLDAFSRLRTSSPENLFSIQSQYSTNTLQMENGATGTGSVPAWQSTSRMVLLTATAGTGTTYTQSYQYHPYEPGKSQFIAITGVMGAGVSGVTKDYGYFDTSNGVIFRQNGTTNLQVGLRTSTSGSVVDNFINQSSWNIDKMDGTGVSTITLDITKSFILIIDLQYLGMGRVRLGFDIDGVIYYVHQFLNANNLSVPYMQTATLPIQILLTANGSSGVGSCYFKCATVQSEGGDISFFGYQFSTPEGTVTAANNTKTHILSIRPKTTFNGITNRNLFLINEINMCVTGNSPIYWELVIGATFSVLPTYNDVNTSNSSYEYGTGGTFSSLTGGTTIMSGYVGGANQAIQTLDKLVSMHYPITLDRSGAVRANGTLTLLVTGIGANSATRASFEYLEIR